jgi:octaprenyl-diphosphate synthase
MLEQLTIPIRSELNAVEEVLAAEIKSDIPLITEAGCYVTQNIGKRIRPAIFILAGKLSGSAGSELVKLAAALELIHTASLLHDDVIDAADLRRGKPSARVKWGNQISVLLGDFIWCKASNLFINNAPFMLHKILVQTVTTIAEGQILEMARLNDLNVADHEYLQIIERKTAALFGVCAEGAAVINNLSDKFREALYHYGFQVGVAFQLKDDLLDYIAEEKVSGKSGGGDFREGKLTMPLILALKKCRDEETRLIKESLLSGQVSPAEFAEIVSIIERYQGFSETEKLARSYVIQAKEALRVFKSSLEIEVLSGIADYVIQRAD